MNSLEKDALRTAVANYMHSEGCGCCQDHEAHSKHKAELGKLLDVPGKPDPDDLWYDFSPYRTPRD